MLEYCQKGRVPPVNSAKKTTDGTKFQEPIQSRKRMQFFFQARDELKCLLCFDLLANITSGEPIWVELPQSLLTGRIDLVK